MINFNSPSRKRRAVAFVVAVLAARIFSLAQLDDVPPSVYNGQEQFRLVQRISLWLIEKQDAARMHESRAKWHLPTNHVTQLVSTSVGYGLLYRFCCSFVLTRLR